MSEHFVDNVSIQLDEGIEIDLKYYVTERTAELSKSPMFGIRIEKRGIITESQDTGPLSYSKNWVYSICNKLISGQVTPIGLFDVINDLTTTIPEC